MNSPIRNTHRAVLVALTLIVAACPQPVVSLDGGSGGGAGGGGGTGSVDGGTNALDSGTGDDAGTIDSGTPALDAGTGELTVVTVNLPKAAQSMAYSTHLEASGGEAPYTWLLSSGVLPQGLMLASDGTVSGTPAASGTFHVVVMVADSAPIQAGAMGAVTLVVSAPLAIKTTPGPVSGAIGVAYSNTFLATGGSPPYGFTAKASTLPKGLTLAASGVLSGTPTTAGRSLFTLTVTDASGQTATAREVVVINGGGSVLITTPSLPGGVLGEPYSTHLTAASGTTPYAWSITAGALPAGITLNADGTLSGTPTASGVASFTVQVKDTSAPKQTDTADLSIDIEPALTVTTTTLPPGAEGASYTTTLSSTGGQGVTSWSLTSGTLPPGLTLSTAGVISGTASQAGTSAFVVTASDASDPPQTASASLSLTVASPLSLRTSTLPNGTVGTAYSQTLQASGGTTPYAWAVASGTLPAGLSLNLTTGALTGTPTTTGLSTFKIAVSDASSPPQLVTSSDVTLFIAGAGALSITTAKLPTSVVGTAYSSSMTATGGTGAYTWSIASGALPSGLRLSTTGDITGTTTASGTATFSVRVADQSLPTQQATASLTLTVYDVLHITTSMLPTGTVGTAYVATLNASGGAAPVSWAITGGGLPAGLSLSASGSITGTSSESGTFTFTVLASDSASQTASALLSVTVASALTISSSDLPDGLVGTAYTSTLKATGGVKPYSWSLTGGQWPQGLTLSAAGVVSGTPTQSGDFLVQLTVTDASGQTKASSFSFFINGAGTLTVTSGPPPTGVVGTAYSTTVTASGGTAPYSWSISAGALPAGLTMSSGGVISGTPTTDGVSTFTVAVIDSTQPTQALATQSLQLTVVAKLQVKGASLADGVLGSPYSAALRATGGLAPISWAVTTGTLPPGLSLNATTGLIAGAPTAAGSTTFTVTATDSGAPAQVASKDFSITVSNPLSISTLATLNATVVGASYSLTLTATGGAPAYTWSGVGGSTIPGLSLSGTGVISGTPTTAGTYNFTVKVEDTSAPKQNDTRSFRLVVAPALSITVNTVPSGVASAPYSTTLSATGGNAPYAWSVSSGSLPAGLSLDAQTGVISGTPTGQGSKDFVVTVTDSTVPAVPATQALTLVIAASGTLTVTTFSLPSGVVSTASSATLTASGGTGPYAWSVTSGAVPTGLSLSSGGVLAGTPSAAGTFLFTATVTDSASHSASRAMSMVINTALVITSPNPLPAAVIDQPYIMVLTSTGGTGMISWTADALPAGLSISMLGVITGTPTGSKMRSSITVHATDSVQNTSATLTLNVDSKMMVTTTSLPMGTVGTAYPTTALMISGGTAPYAWTSQTTLPPGLTLTVNGVIKGTPTTSGDYAIGLTVVDSYAQIAVKVLTITIQ